jgi:hypothetical protein
MSKRRSAVKTIVCIILCYNGQDIVFLLYYFAEQTTKLALHWTRCKTRAAQLRTIKSVCLEQEVIGFLSIAVSSELITRDRQE